MNKQESVLFPIPMDAIEHSGFAPDREFTLHAGEGVLAMTPKEMTVLQAALAVRSLTEVVGDLINGIKRVCGECGAQCGSDGCLYGPQEEPGKCPFVDTSSISLAPPQSTAAGLAHSAVSPLPTKPEGRLCGGPMRAQRSGSHGERRGKGAQWGMPAGRFPRSGLCPDEGEGLVCAADYDHDIADIPPVVLTALDIAGVCRGRLDEAVMNDEVIRHD